MAKLKPLSLSRQALLTFATLCLILAALGTFYCFNLRDVQHRRLTLRARAQHQLQIIDDVPKHLALAQNTLFLQVLRPEAEPMQRCEVTLALPLERSARTDSWRQLLHS